MKNIFISAYRPASAVFHRARWSTSLFVLFIVLLSLHTSADAQYAFGLDSNYGLIELYQQARDDSLILQLGPGFTLGEPLRKSRFVYEWQRPLVAGVEFKGRVGKPRITSTTLVMAGAIGTVSWAMAALGYDDEQIEGTFMYILAPFGSHIGYRATRWLTLYSGMIPEVILFTEQDGILAQSRLGLRIDAGLGLTVNAGMQKSLYWGFESPSRAFPVGFFLGLSYTSPSGGSPLG